MIFKDTGEAEWLITLDVICVPVWYIMYNYSDQSLVVKIEIAWLCMYLIIKIAKCSYLQQGSIFEQVMM